MQTVSNRTVFRPDPGARIDEALFLGGLDKGAFLKTFGADIFFDDQHKHCESARQHVSHGVANE